MSESNITKAYELAREKYAELGVDTEAALRKLATFPISLHCWQGDDVGGFEKPGATLSGGGIQATGNYPGKARTVEELRRDIEAALRMVPGDHRLNLHASYLENGGKFVDRDAIEPRHFQGWIDWAKQNRLGLDFNPTYFSHPKAADGFTLAHADPAIREFWIQHGIACRKIGAEMGRQLGTATVTNVWIPDGYKDVPVDRTAPRQRLVEALDRIFRPFEQAANAIDKKDGGLGLGLAIARGLTELHGGKLTGSSEGPGRGATFTIELPATDLSARTGKHSHRVEALNSGAGAALEQRD